jgi:hypothetical protein
MRRPQQFTILPIILAALLFSSRSTQATPAGQPPLPLWTAPSPVTQDGWPALQSEPVIATAGEHTLIGWIDSRNAAPDLYTAFWKNDQASAEARATNLTPHFDLQRPLGAAVAVEANGRAFAVYSDGEQIRLLRYDPAGARWSAPVQVTRGLSEWHAVARYPQIVTDGAGDLIIVWEDYRNANPADEWANSRGSDIYMTRCDGVAMTCPDNNRKLNTDNTPGDQRRPRIARRGDQVVVIWEDQREFNAEAPQVYFALSADGGGTWGSNIRVSQPTSTAGQRDSATRPALAFAGDGGLFAVWEHHAGALTAPADIYAARWNGASWDAPQRVDSAPPRVRTLAPTIAGGAAGLFVAWQDYRNGANNPDIYTARWNGTRWEEQASIVAPGMQLQPALVVGSRPQLVWQDARNGESDIFLATWQDAAWSAGDVVNSAAARNPYQMAPSVANVGGATHVVFLDNRQGYNELWWSTQPTGETKWSAPVRLPTAANTGGHIAAHGAQIAADGAGKLHAVWSEYVWPYGRQIHHSRYDGGRWSDAHRLSSEIDDGHERFRPAIAARNATVAVVWNQWTWDGQQGRMQIYATWNTGAGWTTPVPVLAAPLIERWVLPPTVALSDSQIFVGWGEWNDQGRGGVKVARQSLQGGGWRYTQVSPTVNSDWCLQQYPHLRSDGSGQLHIVWSGCALRNPPDEWPHDSYIFYATSDDGASFSPPLRVGLTIAPDDEEHLNSTASRPTLALGADGEVMVLYPARVEGSWTFYAAAIRNGAVTAVQRIGDPTTNWAAEGEYNGSWYEGDSAGTLTYDALHQRYSAIFPSWSNQRSPTLMTVHTAGVAPELTEKLYLPAMRR